MKLMKTENDCSFCDEVYAFIKMIPFGLVSSYGDVAKGIGYPGYARAVAYCLRKKPSSLKIPWFRVLRCDLRIAMPVGSSGALLQEKLLRREGKMCKGRPLRQRRWPPAPG